MDQWYGYIGLILDGALVTVEITVLGCALALAAAFIAGMGRISRFWQLRWLATSYVEFFRGIPILVQLFWVYFVLPLLGVPLTPMQAGVLVLGLTAGAFSAETVKAAVLSVRRKQHEVSRALNLTRMQELRHVILPQAFVLMLPRFGDNAVELLKGTAVVSLISLSDMTFQAQVLRVQTGSTAVPFLTILLLYFAFSAAISNGIKGLERRLSRGLDATKG